MSPPDSGPTAHFAIARGNAPGIGDRVHVQAPSGRSATSDTRKLVRPAGALNERTRDCFPGALPPANADWAVGPQNFGVGPNYAKLRCQPEIRRLTNLVLVQSSLRERLQRRRVLPLNCRRRVGLRTSPRSVSRLTASMSTPFSSSLGVSRYMGILRNRASF